MTEWKTVKLDDLRISNCDFGIVYDTKSKDLLKKHKIPETKNDLHAFLMNEKSAKKLPPLLTEIEAKGKSERLNALREALEVAV